MSLQYSLRLALVGWILSIVGCLPEVSIASGDVTDVSKLKLQALESFKSVNPPIQNPTRGSLQRNREQFNIQPYLPLFSSASYNQRKEVHAKNPSFSPADTTAFADVTYSVPNKVQSSIIRQNNPIAFSSAKFNEGTDAKRSYAFQTVQRELNPLDFKVSQLSSSDINLAPRPVRKPGGMHAADVHRSGSFGYQPISTSEMRSGSSRALGFNEPYLREIIPANYMSRSSTVNKNIKHKSDGNMLRDQNKGQNQNVLRRVKPANTSPLIASPNQPERKPLPQAFSAGSGAVSQISYKNMRDVALSKVLKPPTILTPVSPALKRPNSNGGLSTLPIIKSKMFSSQHDHIKLSNSERVASPVTNMQNGFEYGNTKSATSSYTFKNTQFTQNRGQSSQNPVSIETVHNLKKYDNLATGISAIRPPATNNGRSYFQSVESRGVQMSELLKPSKQITDLAPQMQFTKNTMLFSERDKNINLLDPANHSLRKPSQHNTQNRTHVYSFGQSTVQSFPVKYYPAASLVPGNTMKSHVHGVRSSLSGSQGASENSGTSSSKNNPYHLTSKKPYASKDFTFVPTFQSYLQKSETYPGQKPIFESSSNVQYAPARLHTAQTALAQKPLTRESYRKTLFQFKGTESSQEKTPYWDQTSSFEHGPQRETISSNPLSNAPKHHVVRGQAVTMKTSLFGADAINNGAVAEVQSKPAQRWTTSRFASAQPTKSNKDEFPAVSFVGSDLNKAYVKSSSSHKSPTSELVLPIQKSSLINKVTGNAKIHKAVIQPFPGNSLKGRINSAGITNTAKKSSPMRLPPTSSVVIDRQVEDESDQKNVYAIQTSQSPIYRSADINHHKTNNSPMLALQSPIYRSAVKPSDKANTLQANTSSAWRKEMAQISEAGINLSAVGVSQALRPTSSFVVGKYINKFDKTSTKANLNTHSTQSGHFKSLSLLDIVGSTSFTKPHSAATTAEEEVDLRSVQNGINSTSVMEGSFKELVFDNSSLISASQSEMNESTVESHVLEFMPTAAIDFSTQALLSSVFTEEHTPPQPTVYYSEPPLDPGNHTSPTEEDTDPFYEGTFMPNTTLQDNITSV